MWSEEANNSKQLFPEGPQEKRREDQGACSNRMLGLLLEDVMGIAWESLSSVPSPLLILTENLCVHIC